MLRSMAGVGIVALMVGVPQLIGLAASRVVRNRSARVWLGPIAGGTAFALGWWFWGAAHILFLVGGRNRMTVILDWTWAYLTYRRSTRLITGASSGES